MKNSRDQGVVEESGHRSIRQKSVNERHLKGRDPKGTYFRNERNLEVIFIT